MKRIATLDYFGFVARIQAPDGTCCQSEADKPIFHATLTVKGMAADDSDSYVAYEQVNVTLRRAMEFCTFYAMTDLTGVLHSVEIQAE